MMKHLPMGVVKIDDPGSLYLTIHTGDFVYDKTGDETTAQNGVRNRLFVLPSTEVGTAIHSVMPSLPKFSGF